MPGPTHKLKERGIELCLWGTLESPRFTISKRYKDKQTGEYKDSKYLFDNELETILKLVHQMQTFVSNNRTPIPPTVQHEVMGVKLNVKPLVDDDIPW